MRISLYSFALLAAAIPTSAAFSQSFPPGVTPVAGAVVSVSSTAISLQTQQGPVSVHLVQPATVYEGKPSDMSHINVQQLYRRRFSQRRGWQRTRDRHQNLSRGVSRTC